MSGDDGPKETKAERKARTKLEAQERKAKRKAARAAKKAAAGGAATKTVTEDDGGADAPGAPTDAEVAAAMERGDAGALTAEQMRVAAVRAVTGVLASTPEEMDVKFDSFSLMVGGNLLVTDCRLELSQGRKPRAVPELIALVRVALTSARAGRLQLCQSPRRSVAPGLVARSSARADGIGMAPEPVASSCFTIAASS